MRLTLVFQKCFKPVCLHRAACNNQGAAVQAGFRCECQLHWKESCRECFIESDRKLGANNLAAFVVKKTTDLVSCWLLTEGFQGLLFCDKGKYSWSRWDGFNLFTSLIETNKMDQEGPFQWNKQDDPGDQANPDIQPKMFHYWDWEVSSQDLIHVTRFLSHLCECLLCFLSSRIHICPAAFAVDIQNMQLQLLFPLLFQFLISCSQIQMCAQNLLFGICLLWATLRHLQILREQFQQPRPLRCALQGEITPGHRKLWSPISTPISINMRWGSRWWENATKLVLWWAMDVFAWELVQQPQQLFN